MLVPRHEKQNKVKKTFDSFGAKGTVCTKRVGLALQLEPETKKKR